MTNHEQKAGVSMGESEREQGGLWCHHPYRRMNLTIRSWVLTHMKHEVTLNSL